ncbi:MAG: hypothetical protein JW889_10535 [Verrucomicrobia bacterium]|nr:hypothetical protein [Verrucomicrobiota bacterium]
MKLIVTYRVLLAACLVAAAVHGAAAAFGATAVVTDKANVHKSPQEVIDSLTAGTKVVTGRVNGLWVEIQYTKENETQARTGWVQAAFLEPMQEGYDAAVSGHCIVHAQDPRSLDRFDLKAIESYYSAIRGDLVNAQGEPEFTPNVKLRVYLLDKATFAPLAKSAGEPDDSIAFSPTVGSVYLDFSLRNTATAMKAEIVRQMSRLVLLDYAAQPLGRQGAGAPLPLWLVETFAMYQQFRAGLNTDHLLYVDDKPKLSMLVNTQSLPRRFEDRRAFLATAGTLGYLLLSHGTREQFSQLVRIAQTSGARMRGDELLYQFYNMTRVAFNREWSTYVDQLKEQHDIRRMERELKEREDEDRARRE